MPRVRIVDGRMQVGDERRALLSGEMHYWRLDPAAWPDILRAVRQLGLDVVSTYVCWQFHELAPGLHEFDGRSHPRRDLLGFLRLAQHEGFWVLLRPGPYIYAEWPNSGIPDRAVAWHRGDAEFRREAEVWMRAVAEATGPFLATHGGPIVLWQADNEPDPWTDVYARQLGLADTPGPYQDFLQDRYGHIAELNQAWRADLASFGDARAVLAPVPGLEPRYLDVCRFRHAYVTDLARWTAQTYRRLGIDVPIAANTYLGWSVQDWRGLQSACDLVGPDLYPTARIADDPVELRQVQDAIRYARTVAPLAFIPEFEAGIWHGWHARIGVLSATHYSLLGWTALQAGVGGWNWYMLVNRDNWSMSPINEPGVARPDLAPAFADVVRAFRAVDLPGRQQVVETAVTIDVLERAADLPDASAEAVLGALHGADVDYAFFDLAGPAPSAQPLTLYAGGRWLSAAGARLLAGYVDAGGTLVFFQTLPVLDDALRPRNWLDLRLPDGVATAADPQRLRLELGSQAIVLSSPTAFAYAAVPGEPVQAERIAPRAPSQEGGYRHVQLPVGERLAIGYVERRGRGRLVVLGVAPTADLMLAVHAWLGVRVPSRATAPSVHSSVFEHAGEHTLILINTAPVSVETTVTLQLECGWATARDVLTDEPLPRADDALRVAVPAWSGRALRLGLS